MIDKEVVEEYRPLVQFLYKQVKDTVNEYIEQYNYSIISWEIHPLCMHIMRNIIDLVLKNEIWLNTGYIMTCIGAESEVALENCDLVVTNYLWDDGHKDWERMWGLDEEDSL